MQFRAATLQDIPRLEELEQAVVAAERPFNTQIRANNPKYYNLPELINSPDSYLLVVEVQDEIVATGYAKIRNSKSALSHAKDAYLGFMFVSPTFRGQGLNQKVIAELMAWAKNRSVHDFYLDVYADNQAAIRAYEKLGFAPSLVEMKLHTPPA